MSGLKGSSAPFVQRMQAPPIDRQERLTGRTGDLDAERVTRVRILAPGPSRPHRVGHRLLAVIARNQRCRAITALFP